MAVNVYTECVSNEIQAFYQCENHGYRYCMVCYQKEQSRTNSNTNANFRERHHNRSNDSSLPISKNRTVKYKLYDKQQIDQIFATYSIADIPKAICQFFKAREIAHKKQMKHLRKRFAKEISDSQCEFENKLKTIRNVGSEHEKEYMRLILLKNQEADLVNERNRLLSKEIKLKKQAIKKLNDDINILQINIQQKISGK